MTKQSLLGAAALLLALAGGARADVPLQAYGDWKGTATVGAATLRIALHLGAASTLDSPDQGALRLPAASVSDGRHITLTVTGVGVIEGDLSEDGQTLSMVIRQGAGLPVALTRGTFAPPARPQTPAPPFPYAARDVSFDNPAPGGGRLAGTLTMPTGPEPHPAVVLITGSGSQDRDETLFGHKPFLVLADALTRRGVAVLRLDDRGVGGSARGGPNDTDRDFATDTEAALAWLRTQPGIDKARLGLIGHSAGGIIAPMVAQRDKGVAFVVLWAGSGVDGLEIITEQVRQQGLASGLPPQALAANTALERELLTAVRNAPTAEAVGPAVAKVQADRGLPPLPPQTIATFASAWYRNFLSYDPAPALRALQIPVLAVVGEKDTQVSAEQNIPALRAALAGDTKATVTALPGLNHLLQPATTGMPAEYEKIETTIDPAALKLIVDWVARTAGL